MDDLWVVCTFWQFQQWYYEHSCTCFCLNTCFHFSWVCMEEWSFRSMVILCFTFCGAAKLFSTVAALFHTPISRWEVHAGLSEAGGCVHFLRPYHLISPKGSSSPLPGVPSSQQQKQVSGGLVLWGEVVGNYHLGLGKRTDVCNPSVAILYFLRVR